MQKGRILMSYREWAGNYRRSAYYLKEQIDSVEAKLKKCFLWGSLQPEGAAQCAVRNVSGLSGNGKNSFGQSPPL